MKQAAPRSAGRTLNTISFFFSLSGYVTKPLVPLFTVALGGSSFMVGLVVGVASSLPIFLALSVGLLTDRLGARALIIAGAMLLLLSSAFRTAVPTISFLIIGQVCMGIAYLFFFLATQSYVARLGEFEERAHHFGMWTFSSSAGQLVGPIVGGSLTDFLLGSVTRPVTAYRIVFAAAGIAVIPAVVLAFTLPQLFRYPNPNENVHTAVAQAWRLARRPGVAVGSLTTIAFMLSAGVLQSFYPVYLSHKGLSTSMISILYSAHPLASMVVRPIFGPLTRLLGRRRLMMSGLVCMAIGWIAVPFSPNAVALFFLVVLSGAGFGLGTTMTMVLVTDGTPPSQNGLALGIRLLCKEVAETVGPAMSGVVAGAFGLASTFLLAGAWAVSGLVPCTLPFKKGTLFQSLGAVPANRSATSKEPSVTPRDFG